MSPKMYSQKVLGELAELGFSHTFNIRHGMLHCTETDQYYSPKKVSLCASFRYDGYTDPDSSQIIYALETDDGTRGAVSDAYGVYSDPRLSHFLEKVNDRRKESTLAMIVPASRTIRISARDDSKA